MKKVSDSTWQQLNKFGYKNNIKWKAYKRVLKKYNVANRFDSNTAQAMGGFVIAMVAGIVDSGEATLNQIKKELLCK